ncbi:phosphoesterase [Cenococcum geophilum 1.58]|uniref:phosphoesterase n=1 Tax=Cenococcum geophilum 1.58 TaxID=794803 RepID=UPI00358E3F18|nr:phosphoesterase [Cenococcum geophilum 1.58]
MTPQNSPRVVKLPKQRLRNLAAILLKLHPLHSSPLRPPTDCSSPIKVVCISDTHNAQPVLPPGDILIHAGDLTENGSFDEIQAQLTWLSSQPHRHKVYVAGNHDVLLDEGFLEKYPERKYGQTQTMHHLNWGNVHYLRDSSVTFDFPSAKPNGENISGFKSRNLTIYGSPWTPQYGISAFQHPREQDNWTNRIPADSDIVVTHGPPRLHLDTRDFHHAGCPFLAQEIARVRPRIIVFGHIHASYGREDIVLNSVRWAYEEILTDWAGWEAMCRMGFGILLARIRAIFTTKEKMIKAEKITAFVNAAVVGGIENQLQNQPITVEL